MSESLLWIWRWTSCNAQTLANQKRNWIIIMLLGLSIRQGAFIREELLIHTQRHKADWSDFRFGYTTLIVFTSWRANCCRLISTLFCQFTDILCCLFCMGSFASIYRDFMVPFFLAISKAGVMIPPLCVNLQILRTLELPVCLFVPRLIDQFTKIYDPPFGSIYRELWWNICHNLQGFFNPLVVLQIEDLRPACTNILSIFC